MRVQERRNTKRKHKPGDEGVGERKDFASQKLAFDESAHQGTYYYDIGDTFGPDHDLSHLGPNLPSTLTAHDLFEYRSNPGSTR